MHPNRKLAIIKIYFWVTGIFLLFWWPLSHWFYPDAYHALLGFAPGSYQEGMVAVIGTCGIVPVFLMISAARNPVRKRDSVAALVVFAVVMAATYIYLISTGRFPQKEIFNVGLSLFSALFIIVFYPFEIASTKSPAKFSKQSEPQERRSGQ